MRPRRTPRTSPSKARKVLLDGAFLHSLEASDDPHHMAARSAYDTLLSRYVAGDDLLLALSSDLDPLPVEFRTEALAPVVTLHVARQHRAEAAHVMARFALPAEVALTVVMMQRDKIRTIVTTGPAYGDLDVTAIDVSDLAEPNPE